MVTRLRLIAKPPKRRRKPFVYHPPCGPVELELRQAAKFRTKCGASRQDELERLLATAIDLTLYNQVSEQAAGWIAAALSYYHDGYEVPEPDKSKWLSVTMQYVLGVPTLKQFLKKRLQRASVRDKAQNRNDRPSVESGSGSAAPLE